MPKTVIEAAGSINVHSLAHLRLLFSGIVYFPVSFPLPLQQSLNVQTGLCIECCSFRLQSADLPGYTWQ